MNTNTKSTQVFQIGCLLYIESVANYFFEEDFNNDENGSWLIVLELQRNFQILVILQIMYMSRLLQEIWNISAKNFFSNHYMIKKIYLYNQKYYLKTRVDVYRDYFGQPEYFLKWSDFKALKIR